MNTGIPLAPEALPKEVDPAIKSVAAWVNQLGRTLKTCRLYDGNNPTVIRFRDDLYAALTRLLDDLGSVTLKFTADDVKFDEASLYPARSRDDNLALPFHRDGVRSLTFKSGITSVELQTLVDGVLQVSGQNLAEDDLVTLLWEAGLDHLDVDFVPSEGDVGGSEVVGSEETAVMWPQGGVEATAAGETAVEPPTDGQTAASGARSDDWTTGELTVEIEAGFVELDSLAPSEVARFNQEFSAEHEVTTTTTALAIVRAALASEVTDEDRQEFQQFTPRLLRLTLARGAWLEGLEALDLMGGAEGPLLSGMVQELLQPISIATMVEQLDQQEPDAVGDFVEFAKAIGDPGIDLLNAALGESQQRRNRRLLAQSLAELCRARPERLAPFLNDRRWHVVRNIVHILGWIGGNGIVGMLRTALKHPEPRVRFEVVAALGQVDPAVARPILVKILERADARLFCAVLHQLSSERDPGVARLLLVYMTAEGFEQRSLEERRSIYSTLASVGADEVVPGLEAELIKTSWFSAEQEIHRQSVARILARIGSDAAKLVLQRGLLSRRGQIRKACEDALTGIAA